MAACLRALLSFVVVAISPLLGQCSSSESWEQLETDNVSRETLIVLSGRKPLALEPASLRAPVGGAGAGVLSLMELQQSGSGSSRRASRAMALGVSTLGFLVLGMVPNALTSLQFA